ALPKDDENDDTDEGAAASDEPSAGRASPARSAFGASSAWPTGMDDSGSDVDSDGSPSWEEDPEHFPLESEISADLDASVARAREAGNAEEVAPLERHPRPADALAGIEETGHDAAEPAARRGASQTMAAELRPLEPVNVWFDEGKRTASSDALSPVLAQARQVAQVMVRRAGMNETGLKATITGRGNGRSGFLRAGRTSAAARHRAEFVRDQFLAALSQELEVLQGDRPVVSVSDIEVRLVTEIGRTTAAVTAEDMRRTTVEITLADSFTPQQRAAIGYDRVMDGLSELVMSRNDLSTRIAEYTALADSGLAHYELPDSTRDQLVALNRSLAAHRDPAVKERVRTFVNEAVLAASLTPVRDQPGRSRWGGRQRDRREIRVISSHRLSRLLGELDAFVSLGRDPFTDALSSTRAIDLPAEADLPVRLAVLGLLNLSEAGRSGVVSSELYTALLANPPALVESMFASTGHEEQYFLATCVAAAVDTAVRVTLPNIVALLHIGRTAATATENSIRKVPSDVRGKSDRLFRRSLEEMVLERVADARAEFDVIERWARELIDSDQSDPEVRREWRALSERWGRAMQKLAAADLTGGTAPVLTRKIIKGHWATSAIVAAPVLVDRGWRRLIGVDQMTYVETFRRQLADTFRTQLAFGPDETLFGSSRSTTDERVFLADLDSARLAAFWQRVAATNGVIVATTGHQVHVQATVVDEEPVFILNDGKLSDPSVLTTREFAEWAERRDASVSAANTPGDDDRSVGSDESQTGVDGRFVTVPVVSEPGEPVGFLFPTEQSRLEREPDVSSIVSVTVAREPVALPFEARPVLPPIFEDDGDDEAAANQADSVVDGSTGSADDTAVTEHAPSP
ncbi:hypothetical protein LX90_009324, partial [Lentzea flava]|nr:hypothetical protein [Lentzea flava]